MTMNLFIMFSLGLLMFARDGFRTSVSRGVRVIVRTSVVTSFLSLVSGGGGVSVSSFEIVKDLFGVLCIESACD